MVTNLSQLREHFQKNLADHLRDLSNRPLALQALGSATAILSTLKSPEYSKRTKKQEDLAEREILSSIVDSARQYLDKACHALQIRNTYGIPIYRAFVEQEYADVITFLQYHSKLIRNLSIDDFSETVLTAQTAGTENDNLPPIGLARQNPFLQSHLHYRDFLEHEKKSLESGGSAKWKNRYEFVGSQAKAMELLDGLDLADVIRINGVKPNSQQLADMWIDLFNQEINNLYHKRRVNMGRKKDKAPFLNGMAQLVTAKASQNRKKPGSSQKAAS
jgi:hypothetical protein